MRSHLHAGAGHLNAPTVAGLCSDAENLALRAGILRLKKHGRRHLHITVCWVFDAFVLTCSQERGCDSLATLDWLSHKDSYYFGRGQRQVRRVEAPRFSCRLQHQFVAMTAKTAEVVIS